MMAIELIEPLEATFLLPLSYMGTKKLLFLGGRNYNGDTNKSFCYDVTYGFDLF